MLSSRILVSFAISIALAISLHSAPPPVADFVRRPEISSVQISEDGSLVSFLTPAKGEYFDFNLYDVATKTSKKFDLGGEEVFSYEWLDANRVLLGTFNTGLGVRGRLQIFDAKRGKITANVTYSGQSVSVLRGLRRDPKFFSAYFPKDADGSSGLAIINTNLRPPMTAGQSNGRFNVHEWIEIPEGEYHGAIPDHDGEVRIVILYRDQKLRFHYRTSPSAPWTELPIDAETSSIVGFTNDPDLIYVARYTNDSVSSSLHRYRVSNGEFGPPLVEEPFYSLGAAALIGLRQPDGTIRHVALVYDRDFPAVLPLDPEFAEAMNTINAKLPGRLNLVRSCDQRLQRFVVSSQNGREPARYAIYDRAAKTFLPLPAPTPWFKPAEMSVMRPIRFKARDGLELEGYLSLPTPRADGAKPPLVVYAHGGPWARDSWGFDSTTQLLTSRGYAVFQPNYRGSAGFSRAVSKADEFEFRKMHDDVTDGVRHLVRQGIVDEKRLAIFGASFGGYLAVAGVAFEPDLYKCAITFAGVFDWKQMIRQRWTNSDDDRYNYEYLLKKLGDPTKQQDRFDAMSPIKHVAAIKSPVFVIHGELDSTVDAAQSSRLLSELSRHKVPHEKLFFATEVHGFVERKNEQQYLEAVERFLAAHL